MKINANDIFDLLRQHAETYADAKCTVETYHVIILYTRDLGVA